VAPITPVSFAIAGQLARAFLHVFFQPSCALDAFWADHAPRAKKLRRVQFARFPCGKEPTAPLRTHTSIGKRFAGSCNRTLKAAHEADLGAIIHPSPIGILDAHAGTQARGSVLEQTARKSERHCNAIFFVLGLGAIAGLRRSSARGNLGSRGADAPSGVRATLEGLPCVHAEEPNYEPAKDRAEFTRPLGF